MIEALLSGKLQGQPEQRTAKTGRAYVQARMRVAAGVDEALFVRVTAFSESACAALLALGDGDALAVVGTLKPGAWVDRDGNAKPNLDLVAAQVLTAYHLKRRREAVQSGEGGTDTTPAPRPARAAQPAPRPQRCATPDTGDFRGADDAWLDGCAASKAPADRAGADPHAGRENVVTDRPGARAALAADLAAQGNSCPTIPPRPSA